MADQVFYNQTFPCLIRNKEMILYQGNAFALSTKNYQGKLDILPSHTHFISIIEDSISIIKEDRKVANFPVQKGILKVFDNEVKVYLGIFSSVSEEKSIQQSVVSSQ